MTIDREELRPCPFCGRTDLLGFEAHPESHFVGVRCRACGCIGPSKLSLEKVESAAHWNRRDNAADRRIAELEQSNAERGKAIVSYQRSCEVNADQIADLSARLTVSTAATVADRQLINRLEDGLMEACVALELASRNLPAGVEPDALAIASRLRRLCD